MHGQMRTAPRNGSRPKTETNHITKAQCLGIAAAWAALWAIIDLASWAGAAPWA